jgi:hypothetical protein
MDDEDAFLAAFEQGLLPNSALHHRDHVRLTWLYLRRDGRAQGPRSVADRIQRFATARGAAHLFHVSVTAFWVRLVRHVTDALPSVSRFDELLVACPLLADKSAVYRHYSRELLNSPAARQSWMAPHPRPVP